MPSWVDIFEGIINSVAIPIPILWIVFPRGNRIRADKPADPWVVIAGIVEQQAAVVQVLDVYKRQSLYPAV